MSARSQSALRAGPWALVLLLGGLDAFAARHYLNSDGIAYLDLADAWARGDWRAALNAYWSPLYSILLTPVVWLARGTRAWETPLAHALNLLVLAGAIAAFELFLRSALARVTLDAGEARAARIWAWALFGRAATAMAGVAIVTPDLLVVIATFVLAALLCRIAGGDARARTFLMVGITVGLGYLSKLVVAASGLAALAIAVMLIRPPRRALPGAALALATALLVAGPFVAALSVREARFTLGDAGRLNYIWSLRAYGGNVGPARSLELQSGGVNRPTVIVEAPRAWAFGGDAPGTMPFWYAPARWNRGQSVPFSAYAQRRVIVENLRQLGRFLVPWTPALLALAILVVAAGRTARAAGCPLWYVALFAAVPFAAYLPVHLEARFVSGTLVLLLFVAFVSLPRAEGRARRWREVLAWLVLLTLLAPAFALRVRTVADYVSGERPPAPAEAAAGRLRTLGLVAGDGVAVVGNFYEVQWARLAGLRVVAVVDADEAFDTARTGLAPPAQVAAALAAAGARAVVSDRGPAPAVAPGEWSVLQGSLAARRLGR